MPRTRNMELQTGKGRLEGRGEPPEPRDGRCRRTNRRFSLRGLPWGCRPCHRGRGQEQRASALAGVRWSLDAAPTD